MNLKLISVIALSLALISCGEKTKDTAKSASSQSEETKQQIASQPREIEEYKAIYLDSVFTGYQQGNPNFKAIAAYNKASQNRRAFKKYLANKYDELMKGHKPKDMQNLEEEIKTNPSPENIEDLKGYISNQQLCMTLADEMIKHLDDMTKEMDSIEQ